MRYVVLGSSAAGVSGVRELRKIDKAAEIILVSKDEDIYSRCILHHYLSGTRDKKGISFVEDNFETLYNVIWKKGVNCKGIDCTAKTVLLEGPAGEEVLAYDKLLIATGSHTFIPPIPNIKEAKNVIGFRNLEDIEIIKTISQTAKHIVIMGAGLVGLDCAVGLIEAGKKSVIVEMAGWPLSKQLDEKAAKVYIDALKAHGVEQYYGTGIKEARLNEEGEIDSLLLTDGTTLPCDYLIVTAGVRANVEFLEGSGIETSRFGLIYDETGKTSNDDIYGAGDVSGLRPIWPVAVKEGMIAASNMAGVPRKMTDFFASKSTMNFFGIPTMSLGQVEPEEGDTVEMEEKNGRYKKIVHQNGKIKGAILQHDLAYGGILQQLIAHKIDISKVKKPVFDIDYSDFFHMKENFEFYYNE